MHPFLFSWGGGGGGVERIQSKVPYYESRTGDLTKTQPGTFLKRHHLRQQGPKKGHIFDDLFGGSMLCLGRLASSRDPPTGNVVLYSLIQNA